jgi:hypothetical protein
MFSFFLTHILTPCCKPADRKSVYTHFGNQFYAIHVSDQNEIGVIDEKRAAWYYPDFQLTNGFQLQDNNAEKVTSNNDGVYCILSTKADQYCGLPRRQRPAWLMGNEMLGLSLDYTTTAWVTTGGYIYSNYKSKLYYVHTEHPENIDVVITGRLMCRLTESFSVYCTRQWTDRYPKWELIVAQASSIAMQGYALCYAVQQDQTVQCLPDWTHPSERVSLFLKATQISLNKRGVLCGVNRQKASAWCQEQLTQLLFSEDVIPW